MGKRKKQERRLERQQEKKHERQQPAGKQEEKLGMPLSQKFKIVAVACMAVTATITIVLLAVFF